MSIDITNHLIPYAQVKQMLATAWDEAYWQGVEDERTAEAVQMGVGPNRNNPYRDN